MCLPSCLKLLVRAAGLEPARIKREILSLLCLPFHHARVVNYNIVHPAYAVNWVFDLSVRLER